MLPPRGKQGPTSERNLNSIILNNSGGYSVHCTAIDMSEASMAKAPCSNCRARHQRCDKRLPVCHRCELRGLECKPVQKKTVFRHGSTASFDTSFTRGQVWVNSKPKSWRPPKHTPVSRNNHEITPGSLDANECYMNDESPGVSVLDERIRTSPSPHPITPRDTSTASNNIRAEDYQTINFASPQEGTFQRLQTSNHLSSPLSSSRSVENTQIHIGGTDHSYIGSGAYRHLNYWDPETNIDYSISPTPTFDSVTESVQEACLMRYFIEELSPWFDHCDELRHFQFVVPRRAQSCPTLKNAIFAVSSRRLCRLPKYSTSKGICYRGQLLPCLKKSSALEYMLKCIPDLVRFPEIQDPVHQENIMAATVILRQYEEMDEEMDENELDTDYYDDQRVNFLAITQSIIDSMTESPLENSLANAAYWIVIRQEIYHAYTRENVPHMRFDTNKWRNTSIASDMIMFAGEVATWCWGQKHPGEWSQLKLREQQLAHDCMGEIEPILDLNADRAKGKIFPTVWYKYDVQVTAIQHFRLAQMILIAESPCLEKATRAAHRKAEAQVRATVLNICGIALGHLRIQPALVNAVIAITLYGEYFTDRDERDALVGIINRTKELHAWPMRKPYETLQRRWEMVDDAEL